MNPGDLDSGEPRPPVRLMIVDDHPIVRRSLRGLLQAYEPGLQVVAEAGNAADALMHAEVSRLDLVLTDLHMRPVDGIALMGLLRERQPELLFVVFTASDSEAHMLDAMDGGAGGFVTKEAEPGEIVRAIEAVMRGAFHYPAGLRQALDRRRRQPQLTTREREVLRGVCAGQGSKEIGRALGIDPRTVETHRANIRRRFALDSTAAMVRFGIEQGFGKG